MRGSKTEGEVSVSPSGDGLERSSLHASVKTEDRSWEGELFLSPGLVQVREGDGSLRNLPFTTESCGPRGVKFFHEGRVRTVSSVGGVGGRVEGSQSEGAVSAPMNGQVIKVTAKVGDQLQCGDIVLILEAMKMENEVTAPMAGTLIELSVSPGQTVSPGQPMFLLEATE